MVFRRKRSAKEQAATEKRARAAARLYLTGQKVRRYESPSMIAKHGRAPWPAKKAAAEAYNSVKRAAAVGDRHPSGDLTRRWHKKSSGDGRTKTSTGGKWTLRKANVRRAADGTFRSK